MENAIWNLVLRLYNVPQSVIKAKLCIFTRKERYFMVYHVGTLRQIHQQLVDDGYQISEYALRRWIKEGKLPHICTGNKSLISYERVLEILGCPLATEPTAIIS